MLICYRKTDNRIVHAAMSDKAEITHDIACIDKSHETYQCVQLLNDGALVNEHWLYEYRPQANPPYEKLKKRYVKASCSLQAISADKYRGQAGSSAQMNISFEDEDGNPVLPSCTLKLKCNRGSLSQREFVLSGQVSNLSVNWLFPDETVDLELGFFIVGEALQMQFNNTTTKLLSIELE